MSLGPYGRLYLCVLDDPKFQDIAHDSKRFGDFCRLLLLAEAAWPEAPAVPRWLDDESLEFLASRAVVDRVNGDRFRVHGLDKERTSRSERARASANQRWHGAAMRPHSDSSATAMRPHSDSNARTSSPDSVSVSSNEELETSSHAPAREEVAEDQAFVEAVCVAMRVVSPNPDGMAWIDRLADEHGKDPTVDALAKAAKVAPKHKVISTAEGFLQRDRLARERSQERQRQEEQEEARRDRSARAKASLKPSAQARDDLRPLGAILPGLRQSLTQDDMVPPDEISSSSGDGRLPDGEQA